MSPDSRPVVVTGANGQLGRALVAALAGREVAALDIDTLDIVDHDAVVGEMRSLRPSVIINTAAYTAVDACEANSAAVFAVNSTAVGYLVEAAAEVDAHLVQLSTDYVFSGDQPEPYVETDATNPQSVYGRSKLAGEVAAGPNATVVRTSWLNSAHGSNMVKTVLRLAENHSTLSFVDDQRGHPSFAGDIAPVIVRLADERLGGVFHLTNQGPVSWYEFAREVLAGAGHDPERVLPIATANLVPPQPAPRPENSVLDNQALRELGWPETRDFREPLAELIADLQAD